MRYGSIALFLVTVTLCSAADDLPAIPPTPKKPVTDEYQGVQVVDDYRWLEPRGEPEVRQWSEQENVRTRAYLDHLPMRPAMVERLNRLNGQFIDSLFGLISRGGVLFAMETQPPKLQPLPGDARLRPDDPGSARADRRSERASTRAGPRRSISMCRRSTAS